MGEVRLDPINLQQTGISRRNIEALRKIQDVIFGAVLETTDVEKYLFSLDKAITPDLDEVRKFNFLLPNQVQNNEEIDELGKISLALLSQSTDSSEIEELRQLILILSTQHTDIFSGFASISTSVDYQTNGNEIVICTAAVSITLDPSPTKGDRLYIKRTNGVVALIGTIDGSTGTTLDIDNDSVTLVYENGWWIL